MERSLSTWFPFGYQISVLKPNRVVFRIHRVQRLMLSKGAKRWIGDDIRIYAIFLTNDYRKGGDISKDDTSILNLFKKFLVSANTSVQF